VVQRLNAVESMASEDVICMDKTGTLTTSRLCLDQVRTFDNDVNDRLRRFAWASMDSENKTIVAIRSHLGPLPDGEKPIVVDQVPFKSQNRYSAVRLKIGGETQTF